MKTKDSPRLKLYHNIRRVSKGRERVLLPNSLCIQRASCNHSWNGWRFCRFSSWVRWVLYVECYFMNAGYVLEVFLYRAPLIWNQGGYLLVQGWNTCLGIMQQWLKVLFSVYGIWIFIQVWFTYLRFHPVFHFKFFWLSGI